MTCIIIVTEGVCGIIATATYNAADKANPKINLGVADVAFVERSLYRCFGCGLGKG